MTQHKGQYIVNSADRWCCRKADIQGRVVGRDDLVSGVDIELRAGIPVVSHFRAERDCRVNRDLAGPDDAAGGCGCGQVAAEATDVIADQGAAIQCDVVAGILEVHDASLNIQVVGEVVNAHQCPRSGFGNVAVAVCDGYRQTATCRDLYICICAKCDKLGKCIVSDDISMAPLSSIPEPATVIVCVTVAPSLKARTAPLATFTLAFE